MVTPFLAARENLPSTPGLVVDLPTVRQNINRLAAYAAEYDLQVRPHTKTHKSRQVARLQVEAGAHGLTVAKLGEAEALAGISKDILIAYPAVDAARLSRVVALAKTHTVRMAVDSREGIDRVAAAARQANVTIGILVDVDVGLHRTGVPTPAAALELAQLVERYRPALQLDGIFFYPGQIWSAANEQQAELQRVDAVLDETLTLWNAHGLSAAIVSGGSTPTLYQSHWVPRQTEVRPGTYVYNDMNTLRAGFCDWQDIAAAIICTVVSTSVAGKAVIDGGSKTFTSDRNVRFPDSGHGFVLEYPGARVSRLSEEHGEIDFTGCTSIPRLGERLSVIPNHICPCINLQDNIWLQQADGSLDFSKVDSRGCLT